MSVPRSVRPGPIDIAKVILSTLAQEHMGPALFLGLIHQLTHNTCWMNRLVDPPSKANLAGSIKLSGGLGWPIIPVLKKIWVAGPPLMGSTYPLAHQQAPSTMACLYSRGAQCWWGKVTNTCEDWMGRGWGYSPSIIVWTTTMNNNINVIHCLVAMSLLVMWQARGRCLWVDSSCYPIWQVPTVYFSHTNQEVCSHAHLCFDFCASHCSNPSSELFSQVLLVNIH